MLENLEKQKIENLKEFKDNKTRFYASKGQFYYFQRRKYLSEAIQYILETNKNENNLKNTKSIKTSIEHIIATNQLQSLFYEIGKKLEALIEAYGLLE